MAELARRGVMLVLASPSGAGKSSISRAIFAQDPNISLSVSVTTRARRPSEIDGRHYRFIDREAFEDLCGKLSVTADVCGHIGDDWPDLPVLTRVGFAACPANAHAEVKARSHWIAATRGGDGAVRELCDFVLRAQGRYDALLAEALA